MKRAIVATLALLMFTCVLPMAQGQESASKEPSPTVVKEQDQSSQDQLSQDVAKLQAQLEQLMAQQQELQKQLRTLSARRNQVGGQEQPVERRGPVPVARPRRERAPAELPVAPVPGAPPVAAPRSAREAPDREAQEQIREVQRQIQRAQDEAKQAMKEAAKAHAEHVPHAQNDQDWAKSMDAYSEQMEKWGQKMERWGQEFGRRQAAAVSGSLSDSEARERPPMPVMPPMPAMPAMPPMPPVPVAVPEIHVPPIEPPVPPPVPQRQENQEEVVSRTEHTVDLAPGRLLDVKNEMGSIAVRGSNEPGCKLTITVKGRAGTKEEAQALVDQVKPVIRLSQDGVSVAMTKPEKEVNREHANRVVTMELVVPRDAQLRLSQAFGDIRLTGLNGSVRAISNMGTIRASDVRGRVVLESNFGSIDFLAPKGFSAKVQAKSQMGSIQSDLPLEVVKPAGVSMGSRASGTVGSGEGDVSLTTNMGSIRIRSEEAGPRRAERSRSEARPRPEPRPRPQRQSQEEF